MRTHSPHSLVQSASCSATGSRVSTEGNRRSSEKNMNTIMIRHSLILAYVINECSTDYTTIVSPGPKYSKIKHDTYIYILLLFCGVWVRGFFQAHAGFCSTLDGLLSSITFYASLDHLDQQGAVYFNCPPPPPPPP